MLTKTFRTDFAMKQIRKPPQRYHHAVIRRLRIVVLLHSAFSYPSGGVVLHAETVALPEWLAKRELHERGDRTFYDGEWYFLHDQDGNKIGPFRPSLFYALR